VSEKLFTARWLVTLGAALCALMTSASPAQASVTCLVATHAAEVGVEHLALEPANGATVSAGTPVVFFAEPLLKTAPTFSVASSPALLSSPDIDSGTGSQSGAFYRFTSTMATAAPRTIYWTASFTFTPYECESPSTFTTPVRTLVVTPSEAELASAKKKSEEEATAKKKREEEEQAAAITGSVSLNGSTIAVNTSGAAEIKLACTGTGTCTGKLSLTGKIPLEKHNKNKTKAKTKTKTETIGTAIFSIPAGKTATIEFKLNAAGRALLSAAHGRLNASLTVFKTSPAPSQSRMHNVRLV